MQDICIAAVIILLPFSLYLHVLFENPSESINFFGLEYYPKFWDIETFIWYLLSKLIPLFLLVVWFLTNPYWWRYFLFAPLILWTDSIARNTFVFGDIIENNRIVFSILVNIFFIGLLLTIQLKSVRKGNTSTIFSSKRNGSTRKYPSLHRAIDKEARSLTEAKQFLPKNEYLRKLMVIRTLINNSLEQPISKNSGSRLKDKWDYLIVALLIFIPFLIYSYKLIPENVQEYKVLWFTLHNNGFVDVSTFYWFVCLKLGSLLPMIVWFLTSRNWWRYAILSPIVLIFYQLLEGIAPQEITDEISFFKAFPLIIAVVCLLGWIAHMVRWKTKILDLYDTITQEIEDMLSKIGSNSEMFSEKEAVFKDLKENTKEMEERQRIDLLMDLREELLKEYALKNRM